AAPVAPEPVRPALEAVPAHARLDPDDLQRLAGPRILPRPPGVEAIGEEVERAPGIDGNPDRAPDDCACQCSRHYQLSRYELPGCSVRFGRFTLIGPRSHARRRPRQSFEPAAREA